MKTTRTTQMKIFSKNCMLNVISTTSKTAEAVIVFLHGGPGNGLTSMIENPVYQSYEKYFGTIHFDQRGCGKSDYDLTKGLTLEQCIDDVKCVVNFAKQQFVDKPVYLFGHSFGGLLALLFAQANPDAVDKLILSSPMITPSAIDVQKKTLSILHQVIRSIDPPSLTKPFEPLIEAGGTLWGFFNSAEMTNWLSMFPKPFPEKDILWQMYAMRNWLFNNCDAKPIFKQLSIDTLCLQGMDDEICDAKLISDTIKKAKNNKVVLSMFDDCSHNIVSQAPEEFTRITTEFLLG